jgi:hypothetical protein
MLQEVERQETLKQREDPFEGVFVNGRRERECWSCLKLGYRSMKRQTSVGERKIEILLLQICRLKNYVALGTSACATVACQFFMSFRGLKAHPDRQ